MKTIITTTRFTFYSSSIKGFGDFVGSEVFQIFTFYSSSIKGTRGSTRKEKFYLFTFYSSSIKGHLVSLEAL